MNLRIGIFGAGGVGGYVGARMALAGEDVTLIGQWPENVDRIKRAGLHVGGTGREQIAKPAALHLHEVQSLVRQPLDVVFLCVKSYDTPWATTMITPYLSPAGFIVSMQNGMNEESIAAFAGWERTMGVVLSTIGVNAVGPGHVVRTTEPAGSTHAVFRVGEVHGRLTHRVREVVRLLNCADSSVGTANLWGERWSKLVTNSISHGLSAATGLTSREILDSRALRRIIISLAAEGIAVGEALGYSLVSIYGAEPGTWTAAARGDHGSMQEIDLRLTERLGRVTGTERPSVAQDLSRGRRTEIEYTSGLVVSKAQGAGIAVPIQRAVLEVVRQVERGNLVPELTTLARIASY
ncbi:MAG: 2-dehydropantoate 2-reductase [Betaproteobacteria bacterium]|nr:2-dehydropantoate 2-reductase [Betaproteobacteria bacterium]